MTVSVAVARYILSNHNGESPTLLLCAYHLWYAFTMESIGRGEFLTDADPDAICDECMRQQRIGSTGAA